MNTFVHRVANDKLIKELKAEMASKFTGIVADVTIITGTYSMFNLSFYDNNKRLIKSFYLSDFTCDLNHHNKSQSEQILQNAVDDDTVERTWIRFLKEHYPEYREEFLKHKAKMAETTIGD